ncbi:chromate efflux transporter [Mesorhizobium sp. A556]
MEPKLCKNPSPKGSALEVFRVFLGLGLTSFGGPVAHLGYFRDAFVVRRKWIDEATYADLVALCQFLPGAASSQVGMAIGLQRAGYAGLLAAWGAFTLPSVLLLVAFGYGFSAFAPESSTGWIQGLKAAAVAVVANAVLGMARNLAPDRERAAVAVGGMIVAMLMPSAIGQVLVIALGAAAGLLWLRPVVSGRMEHDTIAIVISKRQGALYLACFATLLFILPTLASVTQNPMLDMIDSFYRSGSLVFGGGHIMLPLLQAEVVETGHVGREAFLAGYGAAQAIPGPLFSFSAYLGTVYQAPPSGLVGASVALLSIFLPSALLVMGALPFWEKLRTAHLARCALLGINAAVVGLLSAALYDPVFTQGITSPIAMAIAAGAFVALSAWTTPAWIVVLVAGVSGFLFL